MSSPRKNQDLFPPPRAVISPKGTFLSLDPGRPPCSGMVNLQLLQVLEIGFMHWTVFSPPDPSYLPKQGKWDFSYLFFQVKPDDQGGVQFLWPFRAGVELCYALSGDRVHFVQPESLDPGKIDLSSPPNAALFFKVS